MVDPHVPLSLRFGPFVFDEADARLVANSGAVALAPKAFGVLAELLRSAGQLVTKDMLLDIVWGHRHVSESVLKTTISELRAALGDDAKSPRWIETASRRGYRFIGAIESVAIPAQVTPSPVTVPLIGLVSREQALDRLRSAWTRAAAGQRQMFFAAGEAGIGKSTLIEVFVTSLDGVAIAHGQCIEQVGQGEPYLPVLEALAALARVEASVIDLLRRVAPTWLLQLPWLTERDEQDRLRAGLVNSSQDRMLREFSEFVEQFTAARPLLLVTEDLHWCDEATVRLVDHVARRRPSARFMWLGSYRTPELVAEDHPLNGLRHELRARGLCEELLLDPFSEAELALYLAQRHPELAADEDRVRRLHQQTDGLPLFVANVVGELQTGASFASPSEDWVVPETLAGIIERQRCRLDPDTAALLGAAAVCGVEFESSVVALMLERDVADVAARCDELSRHQSWLSAAPLRTPHGEAFEARFVFRHALYRHALYHRLAPSARVGLHRRAAGAIERLHADSLDVFAAVLALHHESGQDALAAMRAYAVASERAQGRFAPREALMLAERGLALIDHRSASVPRLEAELALQHLRGASLTQSSGVTTPEGRAAYRRCAELCELLPPSRSRAWVLPGLVWMFAACGEYAEAERVALHLRSMADAFDDDLLRAAAAVSQALPRLQRGHLIEASRLLNEARTLTQALADPSPPSTVMLDPAAIALGVGAIVHAWRGDVALAKAWTAEALARTELLGRPSLRGFAGRCANLVDIRLDDVDAVFARSEGMREIVRVHRFGQGEGPSLTMLGWSRARKGGGVQGLREAEEGCAVHAAAGAWFDATGLLRLAADAAQAVGDFGASRRHVDEAFAVSQRTGEQLYMPDLWLLRGMLLARDGDVASARAAVEMSARLAHESGALTAELVARLALCELPDATAADLRALGELRARWKDSTPWATLDRVDALLS